MRYEFAKGAPITFVNQGAEIGHGIRFIGESGWVHVVRGQIKASDESILRDLHNESARCRSPSIPSCSAAAAERRTMRRRVSGSDDHTRKFVDAVISGTRANCDIETSVRSDALCQLAAIVVKQNRKLTWDPVAEQFTGDDAANAMLKARPFRGDWRLPEV